MADPITVNPAAKANLAKVLAEEQRRAALLLAQVRLGLASAVLLLAVIPFSVGRTDLAPTLYGNVVFFAVSLVVYLLIRRVPALGKWGSLAVAFVDVPMVALIQYFQAFRLNDHPWHGLPTAVAIPLALVALSTLSLSRPVILLTALMAALSIVRRLVSLDVPLPPILFTVFMAVGMAVLGIAVVGRIRTLVHEARKRDLVGKYILGERLGAGGMAEVFLATYSPEGGFERKVAVKRILPSYSDKPESVALFRREAELGATLAHPNVVQVLDFGADGDTWFIAMEFVDGVPLSRLITFARRAGKPLPLGVAVFILEELAHALAYIHTRTSPTGTALQLVHRDVNPPNVLVSRIGEVKLNDFGVARAADSERLTEAGMLRGKVAYAAPEQLLGQPYDTRADLWALGITAFELLTLQKPFTGADDVALYRACLEDPIPPVRAIRADVSEALEAVLLSLLVRDPLARVQSGDEVVRQIDALGLDRTDARKQLSAWVAEARKTLSEESAFFPTPSAQAGDAATVTQDVRTAPGRTQG